MSQAIRPWASRMCDTDLHMLALMLTTALAGDEDGACRSAALAAGVPRKPGSLVSRDQDRTSTARPDASANVEALQACAHALTSTRDCIYASHLLDVLDGPTRSAELAKLVAYYPAEGEPLSCLVQANALPLVGRDVEDVGQLETWARRSLRGHVVYDETRIHTLTLAELDFTGRSTEDLVVSLEATHTANEGGFDIQDLFVAVPKVVASQGEAKPSMTQEKRRLERVVRSDDGWELWQAEAVLVIEGGSLNRVAFEPADGTLADTHVKVANVTGRAWGFAFGLGGELYPLPSASGRVVPAGHFYAMTHVYVGRFGRYRRTVDAVGRGFDIRRHVAVAVGAEISDDLLETPLDELVAGLRIGIPGSRPGHPWHRFGGFAALGLSDPVNGTVTTTSTTAAGGSVTVTERVDDAYGKFQPKVVLGVDYAF